jgi:hypothetical protein
MVDQSEMKRWLERLMVKMDADKREMMTIMAEMRAKLKANQD